MEPIEVKFYNEIPDELVDFVVIACSYNDRWLWVKHKERNTYEMPGGHREEGESPDEAAERELVEETGAIRYTIQSVSYYSVIGKTRVSLDGKEKYGKLYYAIIEEIGIINSEIERYDLFDSLPKTLTYPEFNPVLYHSLIN